MKRRTFINKSSRVALGLSVSAVGLTACNAKENQGASMEQSTDNNKTNLLKLSLAQWSLNKALFAKELDNLDFAAKTRSLGLDGVEYVNQFFKEEAENIQYLNEMITRAKDADVEQLLIMVDGEGDLAVAEASERNKSIDNHKKWVDAAKYLGCHSIRVNLFGELYDKAKWIDYASEGLSGLADYASEENVNVIVENHGWLSSDAAALVQVMKNVNKPNCGTLPDFGNFCTKRPDGKLWGPECLEEYDKYKGVDELMPFAKAVSAKSYDFDVEGNETTIDYPRMMKIVQSHGYQGFVGVEYEGSRLSAEDGIKATRDLLLKIGKGS